MPPTKTARILAAAAEETRAAWLRYVGTNPTAATGFVAEYNRALDRIEEAPERWPAHARGTHRFLLRRYPYAIVYRIRGDLIEVVAVAHQLRRPRYWRAR